MADEGIPVREIAEVIGDHLGVPVQSIPEEQLGEPFGFFGGLLALDSPASNAFTREITGWAPSGPGLIEDLDKGHYFAPGARSKYLR